MHESVDPSVAHYITALDFIFMSLFRKIQYLYFISVSECHSQCLVQLLSSTSKHFKHCHIKSIDIVSGGSTTGLGSVLKTYHLKCPS